MVRVLRRKGARFFLSTELVVLGFGELATCSVEGDGFCGEKFRTGGLKSASTLIEEMKLLEELHGQSGGARKAINSELWHACAGPLVSLPQPGNLAYYFPQGHSEQVTASTRRLANAHIPSYSSLPSQIMCQVHNVTLHADKETDEIYAQMTLQPVNSENDVYPVPDFGLTKSKQPSEFFCKTLTASDTSTHGGFSVPRRAAEKLFPQLDYSMQPPNQELVVRDLHDNSWTFRHIYRGQPKRHLLTTGWSVFVGSKRLKAGDSVLFIRDEKSQLLLGVRRANHQQALLPSSVLSADSMHIGVLAAAAHASANCSPFTIYYNPRACPSEFVVPLAKYHKAAYGTQVSIGMRFGMMFETEDSSKRRYMGTILGISDVDPVRWPNSKWRNLQVEWDENGYVDRPDRVSLWEIETPENLFVFPSPVSNLKRQYNPEFIDTDMEWRSMIKRRFLQSTENSGGSNPYSLVPGLESADLLKALLKPRNVDSSLQVGYNQSIHASLLRNIRKCVAPLPSSTITGCYKVSNQFAQEVPCETGKQQECISSAQQQPSGGNLVGKQIVPNSVAIESDLAAGTLRLQEEATDGPLSGLNDQYNPELQRNNSNNEGAKVSVLEKHPVKFETSSEEVSNNLDRSLEATLSQARQLHSEALDKQPRENIASCLDTSTRQFSLNKGPDMLLEGGFQMLEQHMELNVARATQIDTLDTNSNCFGHHNSHHTTCYLDNLGWMLPPTCSQSCSPAMKSSESFPCFGKVDPPLFYGSDDTASTFADISAISNITNFMPLDRLNFPSILESSPSQRLPIFAQESIVSPFVNLMPSSETGQCASGALSSEVGDDGSLQKGFAAIQNLSTSCGLKDFAEDCNNHSEIYSSLHFDVNDGSLSADPSISKTSQDGFGMFWNSSVEAPSKSMACNFSSCQDVQSQVTSSLTDFSIQEFADNSAGTSSCNIDVGENTMLNKGSWKQVSPPLRTYTKVQKLGSVGRSIDVTRFRNYDELVSAIACMFGLEGKLDNHRSSEWKLVYVDYENDVLLVGDDPWEEFVSCVRCIRILSPAEVKQMTPEGVELMNNPSAYHSEQNSFSDN